MTNKPKGFAVHRDLAVSAGRKGGQMSKGRVLSDEHKAKLRAAYLKNKAKKDGQ